MPEDKKTKQAKKIQVGDLVYAKGREPMPQAMREAFLKKQTVTIAEFPYFEFENGWSVNVEMGDEIFLATPGNGGAPNRSYRRRYQKAVELTERSNMRAIKEASNKKDSKAMRQALALRRAERKRLRKAGMLYPKKQKAL